MSYFQIVYKVPCMLVHIVYKVAHMLTHIVYKVARMFIHIVYKVACMMHIVYKIARMLVHIVYKNDKKTCAIKNSTLISVITFPSTVNEQIISYRLWEKSYNLL
jgi:hypothetical protein